MAGVQQLLNVLRLALKGFTVQICVINAQEVSGASRCQNVLQRCVSHTGWERRVRR